MFGKVLVANRGEIAVRVIRALRELGIPSLAVFSEADRASLHVRLADEAVLIGPAPSWESYLRIDRILAAAEQRGADAIHPGYGFLSEKAEFAEACEKAGIVFVGPPAEAIRRMGSKTEARKLAKSAGAPVVPGTEEAVCDAGQARSWARQLGYPVLIKASAGGGGKGMRRVDREQELEPALRDAASEAERAFRSGEVYLEKIIENPRHIEIQVLGDHHGHMIHLGERECSVQRRHQKVIEECPSPLVACHPEMRRAMGDAAIFAARAAGYRNAGTVEFLVDQDRNFYFLEMNTRLQVEHPVTEMVCGVDLVHWQLKIAAGQKLTLRQEDIRWRGSAVECRIYAEDPARQFLPSPGLICGLAEPSGPGLRLDSGVYEGWRVPIDYDPLLAKLCAWAEDRPAAIARMARALAEYRVTGIRTNLDFFRNVFLDADFLHARLDTGFLDRFFQRTAASSPDPAQEAAAILAAAVHYRPGPRGDSPERQTPSRWGLDGRSRMLR